MKAKRNRRKKITREMVFNKCKRKHYHGRRSKETDLLSLGEDYL
jgi:hypothetical protein